MYIRNSHIRTSFSLYFLQLADRNCIIVKRSFYFYLNARRLFWTTRLTRGFLYTKKPASKRRQLLLHCSLGLLPSLVILFCLDYIGFGIVILCIFELLPYWVQSYSHSNLSLKKFYSQICILHCMIIEYHPYTFT